MFRMTGWGLSRLSASPYTRDGHQPSLVRRCFCGSVCFGDDGLGAVMPQMIFIDYLGGVLDMSIPASKQDSLT
jgi:hypothetical protein